jgi:hypothetical protein
MYQEISCLSKRPQVSSRRPLTKSAKLGRRSPAPPGRAGRVVADNAKPTKSAYIFE